MIRKAIFVIVICANAASSMIAAPTWITSACISFLMLNYAHGELQVNCYSSVEEFCKANQWFQKGLYENWLSQQPEELQELDSRCRTGCHECTNAYEECAAKFDTQESQLRQIIDRYSSPLSHPSLHRDDEKIVQRLYDRAEFIKEKYCP